MVPDHLQRGEVHRYGCIYRGRGIDTHVANHGCSGCRFVIIWSCVLHGRCTISAKLPKMPRCMRCADRRDYDLHVSI